MDTAALLTLLGFVALAVNRIIEIPKASIKAYFPDPATHGVILRGLSILLGIVFVVGGGSSFNLLAISPTYGQLNPIAGLAITGVVVGAFSNSWDTIAGLFPPRVSSTSLEVSTTKTEAHYSERE